MNRRELTRLLGTGLPASALSPRIALAVASGKLKRPRWPAEDGELEAPKMDRLGL